MMPLGGCFINFFLIYDSLYLLYSLLYLLLLLYLLYICFVARLLLQIKSNSLADWEINVTRQQQ